MDALETRITALLNNALGGGGGCVDGRDWDWDDREFGRVRDVLVQEIITAARDERAEALREAVAVARVCRDAVDAQVNAYLQGRKPNWKSAAQTCHNEIADKPEVWEGLLGAAS